MQLRSHIVLVVSLAIGFGSCSRPASTLPVGDSGQATHSAASSPAYTIDERSGGVVSSATDPSNQGDISDDEALALGNRLAVAVQSQDPRSFAEAFDLGKLLELVGDKSLAPDSPSLEDSPADRLLRATDAFLNKQLTESLENVANRAMRDGTFELVGIRDHSGSRVLLFRLDKTQGPLTYDKVAFTRNGGTVAATDIYHSTTGEWFSKTVRSVATPAEQLPPLPSRGDPGISPDDAKLQELIGAFQDQEYSRVLELHASMSDDSVGRMAMFLVLGAAQNLDDASFQAVVDKCKGKFPHDLQMHLNLAFAFQNRERWDDAIASLRLANLEIGGDPFLEAWQANLLVTSNKPDEAKSLVQSVLEKSPTDWQSNWALIDNCVRRQDFAQAVAVLNGIRDRFGDNAVEFGMGDRFPDLKKSAEYFEWKNVKEESK